jgi:phosphohistidine phosphatase
VIELHLLRHADAGDPAAWTGPDEERPLSEKGRRQAERLARHLAGIGYPFDAVVSSPKLRATQTAKPLATAVGLRVVLEPRLASALGPAELSAILDDAGNPSRPVLVGHDPDFSALLSLLTGVRGEMKKGALARLDIEGPIEPGSANLAYLLPPRLLPR